MPLLGHNPARGISTRLDHHGLRRALRTGIIVSAKAGNGLSPSPKPQPPNRHRIEPTDWTRLGVVGTTPRVGLLVGASVEPDKHVAMHPALRAQHNLQGG